MSLAENKCIPCKGGVPPMEKAKAEALLAELGSGWVLTYEATRLYKQYKFKNFKQALAYVNALGAVAEEEGHHPNFHFTWGEVELEIWTHKISGLTESDFFMAAKADRVFAGLDTARKAG